MYIKLIAKPPRLKRKTKGLQQKVWSFTVRR
jgi:hypothetical protein